MCFEKLLCNHTEAPLGTSGKVTFSWTYPTGHERDVYQTGYAVTLLGSNGKTPIYESGEIKGGDMSLALPDTVVLRPFTRYFWKVVTSLSDGRVCVSDTMKFETACGDDEWNESGAKWIRCDGKVENEPAAPIFFKRKTLKELPVTARAYVFGTGYTFLYVNGKTPDERVLPNANSIYNERCLFETYDVTDMLKRGKNEFGIRTGSGYNVDYCPWGYTFKGRKCIRAMIRLIYADGRHEDIVTDGEWRYRDTSVRKCGMYYGEDYDAREKKYRSRGVAIAEDHPKGKFVPDEMPKLVVYKRISPVGVRICGDRDIYDFGVNAAGVLEVVAEGEEGEELIMTHSEMLHDDGSMDFETNRAARATDKYVFSGNGEELYMPRFTYHGFRYAGLNYNRKNVRIKRVTMCCISSDLETIGRFSCSEPIINRIHELSLNSMRSNLLTISCDCCMRDERTPCQMDSLNVELSAIYNFDMERFYSKWFNDVVDARYLEGNSCGTPDWHADMISVAWNLYLAYGDVAPVKERYDDLKEFFVNMISRSKDNLIYPDYGYGDWCAPNNNTWEEIHACVMTVNSTMLWFYADRMAFFADLLKKSDDVVYFTGEAEKIKKSFEKKYISENGVIDTGRQADQLIPLYFGMLDGETKKKVVNALINRVLKDKNMDTGGYGTMAFLNVLGDIDRFEEAFSALTETSYPGFGWKIANGATSMWEQWAYRGVMHSHNHIFFAGIDSGLYRIFAGVEMIENNFRRVKIEPKLPEAMRFSECELYTPTGRIYVKTEKICDGFEIKVDLPVNCTAEIVFPAESGEGYTFYDGEVICPFEKRVTKGSGRYLFRYVPSKYIIEK